MTDNAAADAVFEDFDQERREDRLRSELQDANNAEREEAERIRSQIGASPNGVEQYARDYLRNMSGFESVVSKHDLSPIESKLVKGSSHGPASDIESGDSHTAKSVHEKKEALLSSAHTPWGFLYQKIHSLSQADKNLIRHVLVCIIGLLLPFSVTIRHLAGQLTNLIPVYTVVLTLRPLQHTSIGMEVNSAMIFIAIWPCIYAYAVFMVAVTIHNLGGYMTLQALAVGGLILLVWKHPPNLPTTVVQLINFSVTAVSMYSAGNFKGLTSEDEIFAKSITILNNGTFSMAMPIAMHLVASFIFFPFMATGRLQDALGARYSAYASLLHKLRPVYDRIAVYTLDPLHESKYDDSCIEADVLQKLDEVRDQEINSITLTQSWLEAALVETRFKFNGEGMAYLDRYDKSLHLTRIARSTASDILGMTNKDFEKLANELRDEKELFENEGSTLRDKNAHSQENDEQRKLELDRIPVLITELSLLLELGAHRFSDLARSRPGDNTYTEDFSVLLKEQEILNSIAEELDKLAVSWTKRYIRMHATLAESRSSELVAAFFRRIKLITYVRALVKLVKAHEDTLLTFQAESRANPNNWKKEWTSTFPFVDQLLKGAQYAARRALYVPPEGTVGRLESAMVKYFSDLGWKGSLKFAFGTAMLSLPAMLPSSYQAYSTVQLINAIFTFEVVLLKTQEGLIIERFFHRLGGIAAGLVLAGIAWEFTCIGGCGTENHEWIFFAFEMLALGAYFFIKQTKPNYAYAFFSLLRTITSMVIIYFNASERTHSYYWITAGYVMLSSVIGAVGALFLALCIWPVSGRLLIRQNLAQVYHDFILLYEQVLTERLKHPEMSECTSQKVAAFEDQIASTLYVNMAGKLRSALLETQQRIRYDAPHEEYVKAVESTRRIWHSLWKLHHLGGIRIYMRDAQGNTVEAMQHETAQAFFAVNRWLTSAFTAVSARLLSDRRDSLPVLRPLAATPPLLKSMVHGFLRQAYQDKKFIDHLLQSNDLSKLLSLPLLAQNLTIISHSLDEVFTFMEHFLNKPTYALDLRDAEEKTFDVYTNHHPYISLV